MMSGYVFVDMIVIMFMGVLIVFGWKSIFWYMVGDDGEIFYFMDVLSDV